MQNTRSVSDHSNRTKIMYDYYYIAGEACTDYCYTIRDIPISCMKSTTQARAEEVLDLIQSTTRQKSAGSIIA
jgi:hypothetical protein